MQVLYTKLQPFFKGKSFIYFYYPPCKEQWWQCCSQHLAKHDDLKFINQELADGFLQDEKIRRQLDFYCLTSLVYFLNILVDVITTALWTQHILYEIHQPMLLTRIGSHQHWQEVCGQHGQAQSGQWSQRRSLSGQVWGLGLIMPDCLLSPRQAADGYNILGFWKY